MEPSVRRRIAEIARAEPDRAALIGFDADLAEQVLTWRQFADRVTHAAGALQAATGPGSRSCAVVPADNNLPAALGIAAALTAQVPVLPLNPATPPAERDAPAPLRHLRHRAARPVRSHSLAGAFNHRVRSLLTVADQGRPWSSVADWSTV